MARIRTIKPEFFKHYELYQAEIDTKLPLRIAYAGLWTACDRDGRFRWRPEALKLDCLPYDKVDFSRVLDALTTRGFIVKYTSQNKDYGYIPSWKEHQHINNRELESILPEPFLELINHCECDDSTRGSRVLDTLTTRQCNYTGEGEGERERKGKEGEKEKTFVFENWKNNFEIYLKELNLVYDKIINDSEFIKTQEKFNPGVDIKLSIEKAKNNYWGKDVGWKKKKLSKTIIIDWESTFVNTLEYNKVLKPKQYATLKQNNTGHHIKYESDPNCEGTYFPELEETELS